MASRVAAKSSKWLSDPSVRVLCLLCAFRVLVEPKSSWLVFMADVSIDCMYRGGLSHVPDSRRPPLDQEPDVKWNREVRKNPELSLRDRSDWMSHRSGLKNLADNRINGSK
ncbi:hypothetical protein PINS_up023316 [Pythium insidiosum]|nr:hypothetical protein PINS_up023316 [Pythium insidiosum]